jgi:hypothetical protein
MLREQVVFHMSIKKITIKELNTDFKADESKTAQSLLKAMKLTHKNRWGKKAMAKRKKQDVEYLEQQIEQVKQNADFLQTSLDESLEKIERLESILEHVKGEK